MSRDRRQWLEDIVESCGKILRFTSGMSYDEFLEDEKTYDAVVRNLEIIGEDAVERIKLQAILNEMGERSKGDLRQIRTRAEEWVQLGFGVGDAGR